MTLEEKVEDQLISLGQQADEIVRLQAKLKESEGKLVSLTADRDQWKGRADQLSEERDIASNAVSDLQGRLTSALGRAAEAELKFEAACKTLGGEIERYRNGRDAAQSRLDSIHRLLVGPHKCHVSEAPEFIERTLLQCIELSKPGVVEKHG